MLNIHLPDPIYEHLPKIYLLLAVLLLITPLGVFKWPLIAVLLAGAGLIKHRRQDYRETLRLRALQERMKKYRSSAKNSPASHPSVVVL